MDTLLIIVAVAAGAGLGFMSALPYLRAKIRLRSSRSRAVELLSVYQATFGCRRDAQTFLAMIGATCSNAAVSRNGLYIPLSAKRDFIDKDYFDSVESFIIGNLSRPLLRAATKRAGLWWDNLKARWNAETPKSEQQTALEMQLRDAFQRYHSLKSECLFRGMAIIMGLFGIGASCWIGKALYDAIQTA